MGYSSLYLLSVGTMVICRAESDNPRFAEKTGNITHGYIRKNQLGAGHQSCLSVQACRQSPPPDCSLHWAHVEQLFDVHKMEALSEFWTWSVSLQLSTFLLQTKEFFPEVCWICFIVKCFSFKLSLCVDNLVWRLFHCILLDQVLFTIQWMSWPSNPI